MATFRVNKTKDFTIISNYHLKDKTLSLKGKGLLSVMLSLPDNWNYSIGGLVAISAENETAIKSTLTELKKHRYLKVTKLKPSETVSGRFEYVYDVYERPFKATDEKQEEEKQGVENQPLENQPVENLPVYKEPIVSSTKDQVLITKDEGKKDGEPPAPSKPQKHKHGEYKNVLLTDEELGKLQSEFPSDWADRIDRLSEYMEYSGRRYKSHLATIRAWARKDGRSRPAPAGSMAEQALKRVYQQSLAEEGREGL